MYSNIDQITDEITKDEKLNSVYLFGSRSRGLGNKGSDYDLCLVIDKGDARDYARKVDAKIYPGDIPVDFVVFNIDSFKENDSQFVTEIKNSELIYKRNNFAKAKVFW